MILARYVMRQALFAMMGAVVGLWLLQMIFAYLSELENLSDTYSMTDALWFIWYRSPYFLVQFIPTGALLGAVIGLGLLAGNSELVVMRAGGVSIYRIIGWAMIPAFLFVLICLSINQFILPIANQKAATIVGNIHNDDFISVQGYWTLDTTDGLGVTYISYADSTGKLGQTKHYQFDDSANLTHALTAQSGTYHGISNERYQWQLTNLNQVNISSASVEREHNNARTLALPIAPDKLHLLTKDPDDLSLTDLYAHQVLLAEQGKRSMRHELSFWQKLFSPFAVLSLVLVASSFVFGSLRSQGLGLRVVMALLTGLLFSYLSDLLGFIALATHLSPMLMAFLPIIISGVFGIWFLNRQS